MSGHQASNSVPEAHYSVEGYTPDENILHLINLARNRCIAALDAELALHGLTSAQWGILRLINEGSERTAADLCRRYDMDPGAVTRMLTKLEEKGLIERERSNADKRVVELALTGAGQQMTGEGLAAVVNILNHAVRDFSTNELETLKITLRRLVANMK
ncbi:MAG: MarR family transcriptional regulator [Proteobacteria bacterium]|nr:MarR family transcriptional regulator [Pseudomonadota bacterium]HQR04265.1 MarR family transcriptional regulator [Rhodocyclaceae bacterium]